MTRTLRSLPFALMTCALFVTACNDDERDQNADPADQCLGGERY